MNTPPDPAQSLIDGAMRDAARARFRLTMRAAIVEHDIGAMLRGELPRVSVPPPLQASPRSDRVLLVEDDDDFAASLSQCLAGEGFAVERARGVHDAAAALEREGFSYAIIDFDLGEGEGYGNEVVEHARAANPAVHVVLMSGVVPGRLPEIAAAVGVVDVLPKPFEPGDLLLTLGPPPSAPATAH